MKKINDRGVLVYFVLLMKSKKWLYCFGMIGRGTTEASIFIVMSFVLKDLYNAGVNSDMVLLMRAVKLIGITLIVTSVLFIIFEYIINSSVKKMIVEVRTKAFSRIGDLPLSFFEKSHTGDMVSRLTNDIQTMELLYSYQVQMLTYTIIYGLSSAVFMFIVEWRMALALILIGIISLIINSRLAGTLQNISGEIQKGQGKMTSELMNLLSGFKTMKMFHLEEITLKKYKQVNNGIVFQLIKKAKKNAALEAGNFLVSSINLVGVMAVGVLMISNGIIDLGSVIAIIQLVSGVSFMFQQTGNLIAQMQGSLSAARRVIDILEEEEEVKKYDTFKICTENNIAVEFNNLTFSYSNSSKVLDGLSLSVEKGEVVAIVGASGSGKSTILKMLLGYYKPQSGEIFITSDCTSSTLLESLRSGMAYVPQEAYLFNGTIEENVRYGRLEASKEEVIQACKVANAHDFIMELPDGYDTSCGERGTRFSTGQRQRIAIARAFLKNANLLLLDEPTSALDAQSELLFRQALDKLIEGRTAFIIAHKLFTIEKADKIYVIDQGRVVEQGRHEELLKLGGVYSKLYQIQFQ